jgi:predicted amidohydrolase
MTSDKPAPEITRVAVVQMKPQIGQVESNRKKSVDFLNQAADEGANLIVLPELSNTGYVFDSKAEALQLAENLEDSPTLQLWEEVCRSRNVHVVAGITEVDDGLLFNTAVVIGPEGTIGKFRKVHLWNKEKLIFEAGNLGFPVFNTSLGRISTVICYDGWFPESYRSCALAGADIVCVPTNWVPMEGQPANAPAMATTLTQAAAHTNSVYIAAADRVGTERGQAFVGQSVIVSYNGSVLAGPASADEEEILFADINLSKAKGTRNWNEFNHPLADRRVDTYGALLGND